MRQYTLQFVCYDSINSCDLTEVLGELVRIFSSKEMYIPVYSKNYNYVSDLDLKEGDIVLAPTAKNAVNVCYVSGEVPLEENKDYNYIIAKITFNNKIKKKNRNKFRKHVLLKEMKKRIEEIKNEKDTLEQAFKLDGIDSVLKEQLQKYLQED